MTFPMTTTASLWDCLAQSARRFPDKPAVRFYGSALSYGDKPRRSPAGCSTRRM